MSASENWTQLLTPAVMQEKLISASLYITAFELLKESIIGRIRSFYRIGFDTESKEYETEVLSRKKNSSLYASLDWLSENGVMDEKEIDEEGIVPGPVLMIQMMLEVLSGNEELLKHYREGGHTGKFGLSLKKLRRRYE